MTVAGASADIRKALPADSDALATLRYRFRAEMAPPVEERAPFLDRCRGWMSNRLAPGGCWTCWLAAIDGRIVGSVWLQLLEKLPIPWQSRNCTDT